MKRLIPSAFIAACLLGSVGQVARAQTSRPYSEYRPDYDRGSYNGRYADWGLLGLSGLFGLLGARRRRTFDSTGRTYYEPTYESTGRTFEPKPTH
jgi:hypothetical protein